MKKQKTKVPVFYKTSNKFGINSENQIVVLKHAKYIIGPNPKDLTKLILEDISKESSFDFGNNKHTITTLTYVKE